MIETLRDIKDVFLDDFSGGRKTLPKPSKRTQTVSALHDADGNLISPARQETTSRTVQSFKWLRYGINHRPSSIELMALPYTHFHHIAMGSIAVTAVVAAVDYVFDAGIADAMYDVKPDPEDESIINFGAEIIHTIGEEAGGK